LGTFSVRAPYSKVQAFAARMRRAGKVRAKRGKTVPDRDLGEITHPL
jgi:hypothetical protein